MNKGYRRVKNGRIITVEPWGNTVTVTDMSGKVLGQEVFSDHIKAMIVAKTI